MGIIMKKVGRPTVHTEQVIQQFLDRVACGESVIQICDSDDMPSRSTICKWLAEDKSFSDKYYHAKQISAAHDADEIQHISRMTLNGVYDPSAARVAMTGLMWSAARKEPKKYGDKIQVGGDTDNPLTLLVKEISGNTLRPKDDSE
jgi:hypothetical protein